LEKVHELDHWDTAGVVLSQRNGWPSDSSYAPTTRDLDDGKAWPLPPAHKVLQSPDGQQQKVAVYEQWIVAPGQHRRRYWQLSAIAVPGDKTVPVVSLLGFGGPATVFKPLPGNPEHTEAPNSVWCWRRIIEVLQGRDLNPDHVAKNVDTVGGREL
jgi:hypothetical protein